MLLAIDSGINTGWCLLERTGASAKKNIELVAAGTARTPLNPELGVQNWADRTGDVLFNLATAMVPWRHEVRGFAVEFPEFVKGESNKLCFMVGRTFGWAADYFPQVGEARLIGVNEWKGQLPKQLSSERVLKQFDRHVFVSPKAAGSVSGHTVDALGVGLYCLGVRIFS